MSEEWRPVVGLEGWYSVSSLGRVRREPHIRNGGKPLLHAREVQRHPRKKGYLQVRIYGPQGSRTKSVHGLVAAAFLGPRPLGYQVNHKNGVKTDNRPANLEYVTPKGNSSHNVANLWHSYGERSAKAKLTAVQVEWVREMYAKGYSTVDLGWLVGIAATNISRIVRRLNWARVV